MKDGNGLRGVRRMVRSKLGELRKRLAIHPVGKLWLLLGLVHSRVGCSIQNMAGLKALNGLSNCRAEQIGLIERCLAAGKAEHMHRGVG